MSTTLLTNHSIRGRKAGILGVSVALLSVISLACGGGSDTPLIPPLLDEIPITGGELIITEVNRDPEPSIDSFIMVVDVAGDVETIQVDPEQDLSQVEITFLTSLPEQVSLEAFYSGTIGSTRVVEAPLFSLGTVTSRILFDPLPPEPPGGPDSGSIRTVRIDQGQLQLP